jgi:hypothetical protein
MGFFKSLFSTPAVQPVTPAVQPVTQSASQVEPTIKETDPEVEEAKRKERLLARQRVGRRQTILTGPSGLPENTQKSTLLGG